MAKTLAVLLLALPLFAATPQEDIHRVLDNQVAAWSRGDVADFMTGYEDSPFTTFVGSTITKGHAQVLANYLKRYPTREKMGKLVFEDLEIHVLDADYASVIGHFRLTRTQEAGGNAAGIFTLLFRRTPQGWKIILDHTS
ncbi:MAG: YybH family protein [Bryobacteraceae bacterium]